MMKCSVLLAVLGTVVVIKALPIAEEVFEFGEARGGIASLPDYQTTLHEVMKRMTGDQIPNACKFNTKLQSKVHLLAVGK